MPVLAVPTSRKQSTLRLLQKWRCHRRRSESVESKRPARKLWTASPVYSSSHSSIGGDPSVGTVLISPDSSLGSSASNRSYRNPRWTRCRYICWTSPRRASRSSIVTGELVIWPFRTSHLISDFSPKIVLGQAGVDQIATILGPELLRTLPFRRPSPPAIRVRFNSSFSLAVELVPLAQQPVVRTAVF